MIAHVLLVSKRNKSLKIEGILNQPLKEIYNLAKSKF